MCSEGSYVDILVLENASQISFHKKKNNCLATALLGSTI